MDRIDQALTRIGTAVDRLEAAIDAPSDGETIWGETTTDAPDQHVAHDRLEEEIRTLRARAEEDAKLRAEAADAVREALRDLRGAMTAADKTGAPSHA